MPNGANPSDYNRFVYVSNGPLIYVDPSGHLGFIATVVVGVSGGAVIGGGVSLVKQAVSGGEIDWKQVRRDASRGAVIGLGLGTGRALVPVLKATGGTAVLTQALGASAGAIALEGLESVDSGELPTTEDLVMGQAETLADALIAPGTSSVLDALTSSQSDPSLQSANEVASVIYVPNAFSTDDCAGGAPELTVTNTLPVPSQPVAPRNVFIPPSLFTGDDDTR